MSQNLTKSGKGTSDSQDKMVTLSGRKYTVFPRLERVRSISFKFKFKGFIIMFSFLVTAAEGAEGPSSGFEVIGRELAELDEGRSQEAMDNFFA